VQGHPNKTQNHRPSSEANGAFGNHGYKVTYLPDMKQCNKCLNKCDRGLLACLGV
jgi:hypothetical protein